MLCIFYTTILYYYRNALNSQNGIRQIEILYNKNLPMIYIFLKVILIIYADQSIMKIDQFRSITIWTSKLSSKRWIYKAFLGDKNTTM